MNNTVDSFIQSRRDEITEALRAQLRIPSVRDDATACEGAPFGRDVRRSLDEALRLMSNLGFAARELDGYVGFLDSNPELPETLGILCHLDVVPEGDGWAHPPYAAEIEDGKLFGRGALDDKGPAISAIYALYALRECGFKFKRNVRIILGCDEESGCGCLEYYKRHEPMPTLSFSPDAEYPVTNSEMNCYTGTLTRKFASQIRIHGGTRHNIVPDLATAFVPLSLNRVLPILEAFMEKSEYACTADSKDDGVEIAVRGLSAHASTPEDGRNAIMALITLLTKLPLDGDDAATALSIYNAFANELHGEALGLDRKDESGRLTLNVGIIDWDENGLNSLVIDIRAPLCVKHEEINEAVSRGFDKSGVTLCASTFSEGYYMPPTTELVSKLTDVYAKRTGEYAAPVAIGGGTYARILKNAVAFGCEPMNGNAPIHMPNEFVAIDSLIFNTMMLADAIRALACE